MIETVFRSEDLPTADRFAWWHEMTCRTHVPTVIRSDHEADFRATMRLLDLGAVQVATLHYPSLRPQRTPKLIRQSDPEMYCLSLTLRGTMTLAQAGRETVLGPQDLALYDTSRPFYGTTSGNGDRAASMTLHIPRTLLPLPAGTVSRLTAVGLSGRQGIGALLCGHLGKLVRHAAEYTAADAARLSAITVDLFAAMCAHHLEADAALPAETHRQVLQTRIHAFIQQHLGDPTLCAETIAAAHQISVRYLYQLFHDQGLTVAAWIRHRRLERCRRDLTDPALRSRPIHAIATRWGFAGNPHFSRTFRAAYGSSPSDYRHQAEHEAVQESATTLQKPSTTFQAD
ncbi:helix-turn-helix domain-containing protein [Streptosporangium roseum]|uniref:AraC family transcriptional regulator n=1 Tax=Streptosporangium roseum (strain ATCC 12428 / DSM 43021 / JCM 3005 / KCTC 9067 / NCIMB 10171 / NRRL 2505 / NI 9100) TaxID=479432 RepID=D2AT05_STRRD|nr:helix-turn-helix domain-containing protein [Streptosporangium roseum]ACZ90482.1 AraC family transcriptional regulator [Streptosporangium roseum DSM 43021]